MINGNLRGAASYGTGGAIALLAIAMVFLVLIIIIVLTDLVSKIAGKDDEKQVKSNPAISNGASTLPLNINDEDATIACLIASIDMRNETKKNIQVVSVREVK